MITSSSNKIEKKIISPIDNQKLIENHKKIASHLETAAKHHNEAAKHQEDGNYEKAANSNIKAQEHHNLANDAQKLTAKNLH